jgi:hypothetical protein
MSIRDMRIGDTIIGKEGHTYTVESKKVDHAAAESVEDDGQLDELSEEPDVSDVPALT